MSDDNKVNGEDDVDLDGNDDELIDDSEAEAGTLVSSSENTVRGPNNFPVDRGQNLQHCDEGYVEVQADDVFTIEEMPEESCCQEDSDEKLDPIIVEFPTDFDEGNNRHFPQDYFDGMNNLLPHELPDIIGGNSDIQPLPQNQSRQEDKSFDVPETNTQDMAETTPEVISETTSNQNGQELKDKRPLISEMPRNRCVVIEDPSLPIYEFECTGCGVLQQSDDKQEINWPSSGECADVEDNVADSSSDNDSSQNYEKHVPLKSASADTKAKQENTSEIKDKNKVAKVIPMEYSSSSDSMVSADELENQNIPSTSKGYNQPFGGYFLQIDSKQMKSLLAVKPSDEAKKKQKVPMATIPELSESEEEPQSSSTHQPKAKSLKMKPIVGNRKDKCNVCNVRLGLCAIRCRCGGYYCAKHRYDKEHNCTFDYKSMGADEIRRNNPKVVAEKVRKL